MGSLRILGLIFSSWYQKEMTSENREGEREKERVRNRQTKKDREERDWALGDGRKEQTHSHKRGDEVRFSSHISELIHLKANSLFKDRRADHLTK